MQSMLKLVLMVFCLLTMPCSIAAELVGVTALGGKVEMLAPAGFGPMPNAMLEIKYPSSRRPTEVLSNETGAVSIAFNHTQDAMLPGQVREAHIAISAMFHNLYPSAQWVRDEVVQQNGRDFMVLELVTPALDTQIHNIIYGTSVDGRFLLVSFNTTVELSAQWLPLGKQMMVSLSIKE